MMRFSRAFGRPSELAHKDAYAGGFLSTRERLHLDVNFASPSDLPREP